MAAPVLGLVPASGDAAAAADLARNTVYLKLQQHTLGNSKKVSTSRVQIGTADKALFRISKSLIDSSTLAAIRGFDAKTREYLDLTCLPFDTGIRFVSLTVVEEVDAELKKRRAEREELVSEFLNEYPLLCQSAATRLKEFYNPADYATLDEVRDSFGMSWQFISFGVPQQIEAISPQIFAQERAKAAAELRVAASDIQQLMRSTLCELVEHLRDRLTPGADGKPKRLYESAVSHLSEFLTYFDHRNVTDDTELKRIADEARSMLRGVSVDALRSTESVRVKIQQDMSEVAAKLAPMVSRVPSRSIRLTSED